MVQSTLKKSKQEDYHVAIIMDGNGRWASAQGLPRTIGHQAGVEAVRRVVEAAPPLGIRMLTLYAFSSDNWKRPPVEVRALMHLLRRHLPLEAERCRQHGVRLSIIGRRDRLPAPVLQAIAQAEALTLDGQTLHVRLALDYSARDALAQAAQLIPTDQPISRDVFARALAQVYHADGCAPDVDLLIRTGGEQRLSDFLLWECAYAELYFTNGHWPDFDEVALATAINAFHRRERRFGKAPAATSPRTHPRFPSLQNDLIHG